MGKSIIIENPLQIFMYIIWLLHDVSKIVGRRKIVSVCFFMMNSPIGMLPDTLQARRLITTGISLGLLHVLAGPDHLSALAALSVGSSYRAFMLGFRWGVGHSSGLIVVAIVFIALKGDLDLRKLGRYCDLLVGLFMIALGCYGVVGAVKTYREKRTKRDHDIASVSFTEKSASKSLSPRTSSDEMKVLQISHSSSIKEFSSMTSATDEESSYAPDISKAEYLPSSIAHGKGKIKSITAASTVQNCCTWCPLIDMHDPSTQKIVSFSIGLLHGVAGPGGILGVLPAVEMQNWRSSCLYLGSFILTSTLSMGTFAALYGESTKRLGATAEAVECGLSIFSSGMSIVVGLTWFILSVLGKLETIFH